MLCRMVMRTCGEHAAAGQVEGESMNTKILRELELPEVEMTPGTVLIQEGADNDNVYVLISGKVEVTARGQRIAVTDAPGAVLGEVAVLLGRRPLATSTVVEPSTFYVIRDFMRFLGEHSEAAVSVAQLLASQLVSSVNHLVMIKEQLGLLQKTIDAYVPAFPTTTDDKPPPPGTL